MSSHSWHIFSKSLGDYRLAAVTYILISLGWLALLVGTYPSIASQFSQFEGLLDSYPEGIKQAFNISATSFSTVEGFVAVEYYSFMYIIIIGILLFSLGAGLVAGEIDRRTAEFTFTLPVKRYTIVLSRFAAALFVGLVVALVNTVGAGLMIAATGYETNWSGIGALSLVQAALVVCLLGLATLASSFFDSRSKVYAAMSGILIGSYMLHILAAFSDKVEKLYYLSFFKYLGDAQTILLEGSVAARDVVILLCIGSLALLAALWQTERRDL